MVIVQVGAAKHNCEDEEELADAQHEGVGLMAPLGDDVAHTALALAVGPTERAGALVRDALAGMTPGAGVAVLAALAPPTGAEPAAQQVAGVDVPARGGVGERRLGRTEDAAVAVPQQESQAVAQQTPSAG